MSPQTISRTLSAGGGTTSGEGFPDHSKRFVRVNRAAADRGTVSAMLMWSHLYADYARATASSVGQAEPATAVDQHPATKGEAISELRRLSGLTWEQLAQLFDVSRRSVHFWASGKPLSAANETRLARVLSVVRHADRGDAGSNRAALVDTSDEASPLQLLTEQRFGEARVALGRGTGRSAPMLEELSAEAKVSRRPLPPAGLFGAKHDRVHLEPGRARGARTARKKPRGRS